MSLKERIRERLKSSRTKTISLWGESVGVRLLSVKDFREVSFKDGDKAADFIARQFFDPETGEQILDADLITADNFKDLVDAFMTANTAGGKDAEKNSETPRSE